MPALIRSLPTLLLLAAPLDAAPLAAGPGLTPIQQTNLAIDAFAVGTPLTPAEQAAILTEDGADHRRDPVRSARGDHAAQRFMLAVRRAAPVHRAEQRQQLMNGLFAGPVTVPDPVQRAIIARHNPVLAVSMADHETLTLRSVAGAIDQMRQMAAFQGRAPLDQAAIRAIAAQLPAQFRAASPTDRRYLAFAESDAIALRSVLARQSPAERARYRRIAGVGPATPAMLRQAAVKTLLIDARRRGTPSNGSLLGLERETERMAFSPLLPHS